MAKKAGFALLWLLVSWGIAFAEMPEGFEVNIDLDTNAFRFIKNEKSDIELRQQAGNYEPQTIAWLFGGHNWNGDTNMYITYNDNDGFFGGTFGICVENNASQASFPNWVKASTMRAWIRPVTWFKATGGIDIESTYADNLDADPGMRIYDGGEQGEWAHTRNPDNITQDEGVLLEGFIGPAAIAFAGRYFNPTVLALSLNPSDPDKNKQNTKYAYKNQSDYSFGARAGSLVGQWGKINASYIIEFINKGDKGNYNIDRDGNILPSSAEAETTKHLFGLYASLAPLPDLGISVGYNGIITKYVDEIYKGAWQKITLPVVYQQAVNLNLRYKGVPKWTFRTDNNFSFWNDKNYTIFDLSSLKDMGIAEESQGTIYADVNHLLIWNGLGIKYEFAKNWRTELYFRNLYRIDTAIDVQGTDEFRFTRDEVRGEIKAYWTPSSKLECYIGVEFGRQITIISEDIHKRKVNGSDGFISLKAVRDTVDSNTEFKIPLGITLKMR